jgi:hypothetical protein
MPSGPQEKLRTRARGEGGGGDRWARGRDLRQCAATGRGHSGAHGTPEPRFQCASAAAPARERRARLEEGGQGQGPRRRGLAPHGAGRSPVQVACVAEVVGCGLERLAEEELIVRLLGPEEGANGLKQEGG